MGLVDFLQMKDLNGGAVHKIMDQYEFCCRNIVDVSAEPEYILSANPSEFVIQKHFFTEGGTQEKMLYYREGVGRDPLAVWAGELAEESLTYGEVWEVWGNVSFN